MFTGESCTLRAGGACFIASHVPQMMWECWISTWERLWQESTEHRARRRAGGTAVPLSSKWSQMGCDRFDGWPQISGVSVSRGRIIFGVLVRLCPQAPFCTFLSCWCGNKNKRQLIGLYQRHTKPRIQQHGQHTQRLHTNLLSSRVYQ